MNMTYWNDVAAIHFDLITSITGFNSGGREGGGSDYYFNIFKWEYFIDFILVYRFKSIMFKERAWNWILQLLWQRHWILLIR